MSDNVDKLGDTTYSLGVPLDTNHEPVRTLKQGHSCCGGCCDMRRAVIAVNGVMCGFIIMSLMDVLGSRQVILQHIANNTTIYNDDMIQESTESWALQMNVPAFIGMKVLQIFCTIAGIIGAIQYNLYGVGLAVIMYTCQIIFGFLTLNPFILVQAFFLYPHIFFIKENNKGIMTKENYHNEKQSCCCV